MCVFTTNLEVWQEDDMANCLTMLPRNTRFLLFLFCVCYFDNTIGLNQANEVNREVLYVYFPGIYAPQSQTACELVTEYVRTAEYLQDIYNRCLGHSTYGVHA